MADRPVTVPAGAKMIPVYLGESPVGVGYVTEDELHIVVPSGHLVKNISESLMMGGLKGVHLGIHYVPAKPQPAVAGVKIVETTERDA